MKMSMKTLRFVAGLGLAAGVMIGCENLLNPDNSAATSGSANTDESGALSLSIKDDSACRGQWHAILEARTAGHPDSAAEAGFLASCVTEVKPDKDKPKPVIPPALLPDSGTRCKWIVAQIEGGRDSLTVSYRKYCPDDCRKLEANDSAGHEKLCREPGPGPKPVPHDSGAVPPKPLPGDDTCKMLMERLSLVKPGEPGRAELEHDFAARCKEPIPHDTTVIPPKPLPGDDTCKMLLEKLSQVKPGEPGRADLEHAFALRCKEPIPPIPTPNPEADTCKMLLEKLAKLDPAGPDYAKYKTEIASRCGGIVPPKPTEHDSICMDLKLRFAAAPIGSAERSALEAALKAQCVIPPPTKDTVVVQPPVTVNCDELRKKLAALAPGTADYIRIAGSIKEHCPEVAPK